MGHMLMAGRHKPSGESSTMPEACSAVVGELCAFSVVPKESDAGCRGQQLNTFLDQKE